MKTLSILIAILILTSCAFHSGTHSSNVTNDPVVHKDIAVGVATTNVVLGIGGLSKDAVISEARKNMVLARPLEGAEQYNNVDVNVKRTFYLIGMKTKVTINADVIAPKDSVNQPSYSEAYLRKIKDHEPESGDNLFAIGDTVILNITKYPQAQIIRFWGEDLNLVEVTYTDSKNVTRTRSISIDRIYIIKPEHNGLARYTRTYHGVVYAFGTKRILVKMAGGEYTTQWYTK